MCTKSSWKNGKQQTTQLKEKNPHHTIKLHKNLARCKWNYTYKS